METICELMGTICELMRTNPELMGTICELMGPLTFAMYSLCTFTVAHIMIGLELAWRCVSPTAPWRSQRASTSG